MQGDTQMKQYWAYIVGYTGSLSNRKLAKLSPIEQYAYGLGEYHCEAGGAPLSVLKLYNHLLDEGWNSDEIRLWMNVRAN
jgi:hypothetical protein